MNRTIALGKLGVLLLAGQVLAQPANAPPARRAPAERRAQPGERVRRLAAPEGPLGQLLGALTGNPDTSQPPLEISKLNDGILALIRPLLDEERGLEYLRLRLDPAETNLARDIVHLVGGARLRSSAWSNDPTQVDLDLRASMQRREDGRPKGLLDGELRFQTDVVALANRAMVRMADRMERRAKQGAVREGPLNAEETFRLRMREKLAATPPLANMDDVADLVLSISGLRLCEINDRIAELKPQLAATPDQKTRAGIEQQIAAARLERDRMLEVRPQVERDPGGQMVALRLSLDRSQIGDATHIERLNIHLAARQVSIRLVGSTLQGMELYALSKPFLLNTLSRVQARDPGTFQLGRGLFRGYLGQLRGAVGEGEELPPPEEVAPKAPAPTPGRKF